MRRAQIAGLSLAVNDMLKLYVEVHNGIFAQPWWRSVPIPGFFKAIDCRRYSVQIAEVEKNLRETTKHIAALCAEVGSTDENYVVTLQQYSEALCIAISALAIIVNRLKAKAEGQTYSMRDYKQDVAAYQNAERQYHALGAEMNNQWHTFSQTNNE